MNPAVSSSSLRSLSAAFQIGDDDNTFGFTGRRFAQLEVERGIADGAFTRIAFSAEWRFLTFFRRRMLPNVFDLHVSTGAGWGDLPVHRLGIVDGSLGLYRPFGALRTITGRPYQGDRYLGILWEHSFRTVPFELLGLRGLVRRGYGIVLSGGHARTWLSPRTSYPDAHVVFEPAAAFHHEIGLAISGPFSILRVDVTARLDTPAVTIGVSSARIF